MTETWPPNGLRLAFEDDFDEPSSTRGLAAPLPPGVELARRHRGDVRDPRLLPAPDHPARAGPVVAGRPHAADARVRDPVRKLLRAGRQHRRPAAVPRRRHRPRGAGGVLGLDPDHGYIELRARGVVTPRSMVAWWMVGLEDRPERCAEICVAEMFGDAVVPGKSTAVGMGLHAFRDPAVTEDFEAVRLPIDVADFHTYAVDWTPEQVDFLVDGELVRSCLGPAAVPDADDARGVRLPGQVRRRGRAGDPGTGRRLPARVRALARHAPSRQTKEHVCARRYDCGRPGRGSRLQPLSASGSPRRQGPSNRRRRTGSLRAPSQYHPHSHPRAPWRARAPGIVG